MIKEVKWNNYAALGDVVLDFTKPDGGIYSTIVLAGENGCGKTTVLSSLSTFLNLGSIEPFDYIRYFTNDNSFKKLLLIKKHLEGILIGIWLAFIRE